jgi:hypothetical protein
MGRRRLTKCSSVGARAELLEFEMFLGRSASYVRFQRLN